VLQQGWEVRTRANSQESRACATVDIRRTPAHRQAPHTRIRRDAADRDGQLVIKGNEFDADQEQFLEMYHYPGQNGILDIFRREAGHMGTESAGRWGRG